MTKIVISGSSLQYLANTLLIDLQEKQTRFIWAEFSFWHNDLGFEYFSVSQFLDRELTNENCKYRFDLATDIGRATFRSVLMLSFAYEWSLRLSTSNDFNSPFFSLDDTVVFADESTLGYFVEATEA